MSWSSMVTSLAKGFGSPVTFRRRTVSAGKAGGNTPTLGTAVQAYAAEVPATVGQEEGRLVRATRLHVEAQPFLDAGEALTADWVVELDGVAVGLTDPVEEVKPRGAVAGYVATLQR